MRAAQVRTRDGKPTLDEVRAGLYDNYTAAQYHEDGQIIITGEDVAGWTLDAQLERLATCLVFAEEMTI